MTEINIKMKIPRACGECKFYSEVPYICHNESGRTAKCSMGYYGGDTRDKSFKNKKYKGCMLELKSTTHTEN